MIDTYINTTKGVLWWDVNTAKPVKEGWYHVVSNNTVQTTAYFSDFGAWEITHIPEGIKYFIASLVITKQQPLLTGWEELR